MSLWREFLAESIGRAMDLEARARREQSYRDANRLRAERERMVQLLAQEERHASH